MKKPRVSAVAALAEKSRALGKDNLLLWQIPEDLKRLRAMTMGHPLVMGRKTMDHLITVAGGALKGRTNIVVSRNKDLQSPGFVIAGSVEEALEKAKQSPGGDKEIFIFGGAQLFTLALPVTDRLYLTIVRDDPEADAFFPDYSEFTKVIEKSEEKKFEDLTYYYLTLERPAA
ncbi:hypothetical protein A3G67_01155 [Candidatus Roizmanbacteria bacterium RIFCSPLOWO2_12_FULL_40_12]|uniref:Dihydrofolate reductase n=1 Tax=Candidatus Roizmanbacteria bacterium RIFCSPLOWO2_01_FULL_40_42 TaxID=1802066 RepID=A0A1F7J246_9BACT|nr:MAG: hypothetical protein A2779_00875 [Candidatus Roizmanbacteria bacterium RIFCSPHIGHO2_01_FULL_40_98]OGK27600.1 MAG: hypothetical protein A3C31_02400 [Candidatus Roizmanbacteria bacterium RIFCSPHIGHO2_02_FULL_40_53]OGK30382.1 MAG: hypothetical protein A2W49_00685 [Candidatus Roizmanbacteria bacterium RIFCSPHIGHO2_12_41_18]OGK36154.1 MAG: hypothetical protein A3E69_01195 [Candidatus Roizmanbacteria bacterium RIFCSPHIGHO2_12_FULL_40_130]OGK49680.1 MAG: hypothetical protein A3B50_03050 [Candi